MWFSSNLLVCKIIQPNYAVVLFTHFQLEQFSTAARTFLYDRQAILFWPCQLGFTQYHEAIFVGHENYISILKLTESSISYILSWLKYIVMVNWSAPETLNDAKSGGGWVLYPGPRAGPISLMDMIFYSQLSVPRSHFSSRAKNTHWWLFAT